MAAVYQGDAPQPAERLDTANKRYYRAKVFKSGNSLAVRLPAGTKVTAGMEMDLTVEDGANLSLRPVGAPKRKFDIDKVWGSATNLQLLESDDRWFAERKLDWGTADSEPSK